jgi:hypothetical protein
MVLKVTPTSNKFNFNTTRELNKQKLSFLKWKCELEGCEILIRQDIDGQNLTSKPLSALKDKFELF